MWNRSMTIAPDEPLCSGQSSACALHCADLRRGIWPFLSLILDLTENEKEQVVVAQLDKDLAKQQGVGHSAENLSLGSTHSRTSNDSCSNRRPSGWLYQKSIHVSTVTIKMLLAAPHCYDVTLRSNRFLSWIFFSPTLRSRDTETAILIKIKINKMVTEHYELARWNDSDGSQNYLIESFWTCFIPRLWYCYPVVTRSPSLAIMPSEKAGYPGRHRSNEIATFRQLSTIRSSLDSVRQNF